MKIFDSNIIIYSSQIEFQFLRSIINRPESYISEISRLEVLGYHQINIIDKSYFESLFSLLSIIPIDKSVVDLAIDLRQKKKMSVGDSIIASTALLYNCELYTRNVNDFSWIENLTVINPFIN
ncbi:type II toxin-antitoxin system VapC family toxin [Arcicella lustrica]|uniref:Type II toxin-antitoxin system VapC family toxin n=1 Tax=Arcicella lustrica TaxID=2984196 RepID=A0ABU5SIK6_9BACT|nr:type II toxin-antitoxin system VapC family toxin [Arcicella sp. DC25W]MEA5427052.1 type II toxin-antitoxin system VapC family toxin [Arcicella sp. DC25W]